MAQTAKTNGAEKAADTVKDTTDNLAELGKRAADQAADTAREGFQAARRASGAALEVERVVARRSAEGAAELGQALVELVNEQTRHNVELVKALARTVDWDEVARLQGEFWRVSLERAAQLTRRYLEVSQALIASAAADAAKDQARKVA